MVVLALVGAAYAVFACSSVILTIGDLKNLRLPNRAIGATLGSTIALFVAAAVAAADASSLLRALACGGGYLAVFILLYILRPLSIGGGDVKFAPVLGVMTGWISLDVALLVTPFAVAALTAVTTVCQRSRGHVNFAFGPVLIGAAWVGILWNTGIVMWGGV